MVLLASNTTNPGVTCFCFSLLWVFFTVAIMAHTTHSAHFFLMRQHGGAKRQQTRSIARRWMSFYSRENIQLPNVACETYRDAIAFIDRLLILFFFFFCSHCASDTGLVCTVCFCERVLLCVRARSITRLAKQ